MTAATITARTSSQQANTDSSSVTRAPMPAAERMREMRARRREAASAPLMFERADWHLFLDRSTLPQKAGCQPSELGRVVLKELVDNALDTGAKVTLKRGCGSYVVADDGPGID